MIIDPMDIDQIKRIYEQLYAHKFYNLDETDYSMKDSNFKAHKRQAQMVLISEPYQTLKKNKLYQLIISSKKRGTGERHSDSF